MAQAYSQDVSVSSVVDLTTIFSSMAGVSSYVQNRGSGRLLVAFSSSGSAPVGGYMLVAPGDTVVGTALHIWAMALNGACTVAMGTTD